MKTDDWKPMVDRLDLGLHGLLSSLQAAVPVGWNVKIGLQVIDGEYAMVGGCSCGDFRVRFGGDDAWERVCQAAGTHVKEVHLRNHLR